MNFSSTVEIGILSSLLFYVAVQVGLMVGLLRLKKGATTATPFVSVIVAARNEQQNIGALLEILLDQTYPDYEIIVVNDRSTDATADVLRSFQKSDARVKVVTVDVFPATMPPKKNALTHGIRAGKGGILCFTDADCLPPRTWIASLVSCFEDGVGVVAGYSPCDANLVRKDSHPGFVQRLLYEFVAGEEFKGAVWAAGSIGMNLAWLCTGRNLAYRREVFEEVGGFEQIKQSVSGDDDLFIQVVRRRTRWKIRYATSERSFVRTAPPSTFAKFVNQRTRHFSAGKFFTLPMKLFFSLFHTSNLLLFAGLFVSFFATSGFEIASIAFVMKIGADLLLTAVGLSVITEEKVYKRFHPFNFLLTEILYIFYNTLIGPLGFIRTFEWKPDRRT